MAIPTWLTASAADIQKDSKITIDMWLKAATDTTLQADITRYVTDWQSIVLGRLQRAALKAGLATDFNDDLSTVLSAAQQKTASMALKLLVISALWQNLPGDAANYFNQANDTGLSGAASDSTDRRLTSGEGLLYELEKQLAVMGVAAGNDALARVGNGMSVQPVRVDGYTNNPIGGTAFDRFVGRR